MKALSISNWLTKLVKNSRLGSLLTLLLFGAAFLVTAQPQPIRDLKPTVILISLDGFRYDYLNKYKPKHLNNLARKGVQARWLIPSFPTKTYPNHYTIATGLYPQNHGIVENNIYDAGVKAVFTLSNREEVQNGRWWLGEPIWVTAEKQGQKAASVFFPGTETEIAGRRPSYWKPYDEKITNVERVRTILSWLDLPDADRPTCLSLYFSDVDDAGHEFSPDSLETKNAVTKVDDEIGLLLKGLREREVSEQINLIIVSDHGMATVNFSNAVFLDELFDTDLAERIFWTREIVSIFPRPGKEAQIYTALRRGLPSHARVYRKAAIPARFHYRSSPRIAPLLVLPDEGWILTNRKLFQELKARGEIQKLKGAHGYDNQLASMRALFIAHGTNFKKTKIVKPFENIHIYNIMARILGLVPAQNDGRFVVAKSVLK